MFAVFIVPTVSALDPDYTFRKDTVVDVKFRCDLSGVPCTSDYLCNASVYYPNGSRMMTNIKATRNTDDYNITFSNTSFTGMHRLEAFCTNGALNGSDTYDVLLNLGGVPPSEQRTDVSGRAIYIMFGIAILFFVAFIFFQANETIKWTFFILSLIFLLIGINVVSVTLQDEVVNPKIENLFDTIAATSFILYWFSFGLLLIIWMLTFLNTYIYKKNMESLRRFGGDMP